MSEFQRFWYGWKMWSFAFTATWHACPQSEGLGSAVNLSDAASSLNTAYPHPPLFGKLLLSFSMTKACVKTSGTSTTKGASVFFFGFHWSFTILEPSGKGWPLPGTPVLYASIIPVAATPTGDRPFAESAGRYEHRPQFFLSL